MSTARLMVGVLGQGAWLLTQLVAYSLLGLAFGIGFFHILNVLRFWLE